MKAWEAPMCSYLQGGTSSSRENMSLSTRDGILSPTRAWQHLISDQQMGELSKGTLVFLGFQEQPATVDHRQSLLLQFCTLTGELPRVSTAPTKFSGGLQEAYWVSRAMLYAPTFNLLKDL